MNNLLLYNKILSLPDNLRSELNDFVDSLKVKAEKKNKKNPKFGSGKGMFKIKKGFEDPLDDFEEYLM